MTLDKLATMFLGVNKSRFQVESNKKFKYKALDYSCFSSNEIDFCKSINISSDILVNEKMFIQDGDIIVKLYPPISFIVAEKVPKNLLPLSNMAIIRLNNSNIDPYVLKFLLLQQQDKIEKTMNNCNLIKILKLNDLRVINIDDEKLKDKKIKIMANLIEKNSQHQKLISKKQTLLEKKIKYYIGGKYE